MAVPDDDVALQVHALVGDLLPVLVPQASFDEESREVLLPVAGGRARISTRTLVAAARAEPQHRWPRTVDGWLRDVRRRVDELPQEEGHVVDLERLRVQALPRVGEHPAGLSAPYGSSFDLLVVEDLPAGARRLQQADLDALGLPAQEVVSRAVTTTVEQVLVRVDARDHALPGDVGIVRMASADGVPYVSAGITSVAQLAGGPIPYGAFVAVPRHSAFLVVRPLSRRSIDALPVLASLAASMHDAADDPCARGVYWFAAGDFHPVGVSGPADAPKLDLGPALRPVVESLPG